MSTAAAEAVAVRELPIVFGGESVRAIFDGRKRMTRRLVTPPPEHRQIHTWRGEVIHESVHRMWCWRDLVLENIWDFPGNEDRRALAARCPYGAPGDLLWVREAWCQFERDPTLRATSAGMVPTGECLPGGIGYRADLDHCGQVPVGEGEDRTWRTPKSGWRSPIHMPRWAARIILRVEAVRVERLQEISEADARAEGVDPYVSGLGPVSRCEYEGEGGPRNGRGYRDGFAHAWDALHGRKPGASWPDNPWVWVVAFERITPAAPAKVVGRVEGGE